MACTTHGRWEMGRVRGICTRTVENHTYHRTKLYIFQECSVWPCTIRLVLIFWQLSNLLNYFLSTLTRSTARRAIASDTFFVSATVYETFVASFNYIPATINVFHRTSAQLVLAPVVRKIISYPRRNLETSWYKNAGGQNVIIQSNVKYYNSVLWYLVKLIRNYQRETFSEQQGI